MIRLEKKREELQKIFRVIEDTTMKKYETRFTNHNLPFIIRGFFLWAMAPCNCVVTLVISLIEFNRIWSMTFGRQGDPKINGTSCLHSFSFGHPVNYFVQDLTDIFTTPNLAVDAVSNPPFCKPTIWQNTTPCRFFCSLCKILYP